MISLKRMLQRKAEQAERKRIREEKKKERELQKLKEKKERRKKKLKSKNNKKYYAKIKRKREKEREKMGEEIGHFRIILTKNRKKFKTLGRYHSKIKALCAFNNAIENNQKEINFPIKYLTTNKSETYEVLYEILLIKSEKEDENGELKIVQFRNAEGKFVDNIITDSNKHVIVDKHVWNIEENFHVYGYHPTKDRKDFNFILNEMVLKDLNSKDDMRSILTYANKVIIKYYDDFDFILCKTTQDANRLVVELERKIPKKLKKYILFLGEISQNKVSYWIDRLVEKTGWSRQACRRVRL